MGTLRTWRSCADLHQVRQGKTNLGWAEDTAAQTQGFILVKFKCSNLDESLSSLLDFLWKCGRLATSSQPTIESVPPKVVEWGDVLLLVHNPPENVVGFVWVKGMTESKNIVAARYIPDRKTTMPVPAYSGRETLYSDGSLLLHNVTLNDSGLYTLEILRTDMTTETAQVQLKVHSKWISAIVQCQWCLDTQDCQGWPCLPSFCTVPHMEVWVLSERHTGRDKLP